jgi:hypothetical protein
MHDLGDILQRKGEWACAQARIDRQTELLVEHKEDLVFLCVVNVQHVDFYHFCFFL